MRNICIIPARGGSKRIPQKNIKDFYGKPIISYSIKLAIDSGIFDEVMVSTDNAEIAEVSKQFGANVPFLRSALNSTDFASTVSVIKEVLKDYELRGDVFNCVCCLYPIAPLLSVEILKRANQLLLSEENDSVVPVVKFPSAIERAFKLKNGKVSLISPEFKNARSQDLEPTFFDPGQFYFSKTSSLLANESFFCDKTFGLEVDEVLAQDVNDLSDWKILETKYYLLNFKR